MITLEAILAAQAKLWTTLDGLHALLRDQYVLISDLKRTLNEQKALFAVHVQNADEIRKAPISSILEFKSLKEGTIRLRNGMKSNLERVQTALKEVTRLKKEIETNQKRLEAMEQRAKALQNPARVVELRSHEDQRSSKAD